MSAARARGRARWRRAVVLLLGAAALVAVLGGAYRLHRSRTFQFFGGLVSRVPTVLPVVALTFDDGPTASGVEAALPVLAAAGARATFFVTGSELAARPDLGQRLVAAGHELGNHSWSHRPLLAMAPSRIRDEIGHTDAEIRRAGQLGPIPVRPPYAKRLFYLPLLLRQQGRPTVLWDVEPESSPEAAGGAEEIVARVLERVRPGSIVLLHLMHPANAESLRALPKIVEGLRSRGYRFLTVSELLALDARP